jgi:hypothetical protein
LEGRGVTEQQVFDALAAELPPDAEISVQRDSYASRGLDKKAALYVHWLVWVRHFPSGYFKRHTVKAHTAEEAIRETLKRWRAYGRLVERTGVPRWVADAADWRLGTRVRVACGRLFCRRGEGAAREVAYVAGRREVVISAAVPRERRRDVLAVALGHASRRKAA